MRQFCKSALGVLLILFIVFPLMIKSSVAVKRDEYKFVLEWGSFGTELGQFRTPVGLEVDKIGNVYVSDMLNHRIQKFNSKGKFLTAFDLYIDQFGSIISYDDISPCGLTLDKEGNIYVADFSNPQVLKYSPNGQFLLRFDTYCSNFDYSFETPVPCDVAVDESGNVYIPVSLSNVIMKFDSSGQYLGNFANDFSFDGPTNIEIDPIGNIIIGQHVNQILKFSSAGDFLLRWQLKYLPNDRLPINFQNGMPFGIDTDSKGNVYAIGVESASAQKFDPNGNFLAQIGSYGNGEGQFDSPWSVAVDTSGFVYVSEGIGEYYYIKPIEGEELEFITFGLNNRIQKFR